MDHGTYLGKKHPELVGKTAALLVPATLRRPLRYGGKLLDKSQVLAQFDDRSLVSPVYPETRAILLELAWDSKTPPSVPLGRQWAFSWSIFWAKDFRVDPRPADDEGTPTYRFKSLGAFSARRWPTSKASTTPLYSTVGPWPAGRAEAAINNLEADAAVVDIAYRGAVSQAVLAAYINRVEPAEDPQNGGPMHAALLTTGKPDNY